MYGDVTSEVNEELRKMEDIFQLSCLRPVRGVVVRNRRKNEALEKVVVCSERVGESKLMRCYGLHGDNTWRDAAEANL